MGVDKLGIGNNIMGLTLKNHDAVRQVAGATIAPNTQTSSYSIHTVRAFSAIVKLAVGPNYESFSGKPPLERTTRETLADCCMALTGKKSKDGYPQDFKYSIQGIANYINEKENLLREAFGYKPNSSSNLTGDSLVHNFTDRLSQVTRMMNAYKNKANFTLPGLNA